MAFPDIRPYTWAVVAATSAEIPLPSFDDRFVRTLAGDPERSRYPRPVLEAMYSFVDPDPVSAPTVVAYSSEVAAMLGLSEAFMDSELAAEVLSGNRLLPGMRPYASAYGGHQFGNWAGQLGDGRAITLGEVKAPDDSRHELQLKGAGTTPYSRGADGRAVLRSSIREFLMSEAMHHLGVPTTRALALVTTGDRVSRDMFYDGHPEEEPGAIVSRVAPSFLRFGNFQLFASRGDIERLRTLAEFTVREHFPELGAPGREVYLELIREVARRTAMMLAHWMRVGFVHGVMNTDNMSIHGLTIDYGPYGWMDAYDPSWTPNTTDAGTRRYRFGQQPRVAYWNLARFAEAMLPLIEDEAAVHDAIEAYPAAYGEAQDRMFRAKLGLVEERGEADRTLIENLLSLMTQVETDMTIFFRLLAKVTVETEAGADRNALGPAYYVDPSDDYWQRMSVWLDRYRERLRSERQTQADRQRRMNLTNPKYVLRNYMAQLAIDQAEAGDASLVTRLLNLLKRPYDEQPAEEEFFARRPDWARNRPGCSMLSCSS